MPSPTRHLYGGQALVEGVMIRGASTISVAVRDPQGNIRSELQPLPAVAKSKLRRIPLVRGLFVVVEMLIAGMRALNYSANIAAEDEGTSEAITGIWEKVISIVVTVLGMGLAIGIFVLIPTLSSDLIESWFEWHYIYANLFEGVLRLLLLVAYLYAIGLIKSVRRVYRYHGAEHKTIAAHEAGVELTPHEIQKFPKEHPRCGTAFLITVALIAIVVFTLLPRGPLPVLLSVRLLSFPLLSGVSYELLRLAGTLGWRPLTVMLSAPGLLAQKLTTSEPDDAMIEVATVALQCAVKADSHTNPA